MTSTDVTIFDKDVIYTILENYDEWIEKKKTELERKRRQDYTHPGMIKFLPEYVFRVSHPAIIGVRVLAGRIKDGIRLMKDDGRIIGSIKGIQSENKAIEEALQGQEVAISIDGVTVGRQIKGEDILYVNIPEAHVRELTCMDLSMEEEEVLEKVIKIKRKEKFSWGM